MNIGIFTETYLPETNGVVFSLLRFRKELEKMGHKVFVFAPNQKLKFKHMPKNRVWLFPSIASIGGGVLHIALPIARPKEFRQFDLDIVHTYAPGPMGFLGIFVARHFKIPAVHTFHTSLEDYTHYIHLGGRKIKNLVRRVTKYFLEKHDYIIAPSSTIKKYVLSYNSNNPVGIIPTGIDMDEIGNLHCDKRAKSFLKKFGISANDSFIVSAGRLGKEKNFNFILEVEAILLAERRGIKLIMAGEGPERAGLEKKALGLGIKSNVIFPGAISQKDLFCLLRLAKVFVFSSLTETQGLVTMEAMAMGTPVVAVRAQGTNDLLAKNKGGFMTDANVKKFTEKVSMLLDNEDLRKIKSAEALKRAGDFSSKKMAERLVAIYDKLLKRKAAGF